MIRILGIFLAAIFAILSLIHFYWAVGGKTGGATVPSDNGNPIFKPTPLATTLVALALLAAMFVILGRIGVWGKSLSDWIFYSGSLVIALLFLFRAIGDFHYVGFFKNVVNTDFARWDKYLFSPLCLFIAIAAFLLCYFEP